MEGLFLAVIGVFLMTGMATAAYVMKETESAATKQRRRPPEWFGPSQQSPRYHGRPEGEVSMAWASGSGTPHKQFMDLRLEIEARLPRFELKPTPVLLAGDGFEGLFTVASQELAAGSLIAAPALQRRLVGLAKRRDTWQGAVSFSVQPTATGSRLWLRKEGWVQDDDAGGVLVDTLCAMARDLLERWDQPWQAVAKRWELPPLTRDREGLRRLEGHTRGVDLLLEERATFSALTTWLTVGVPGLASLGEIRVAHKDVAKTEGWSLRALPTGNPVLDMTVTVLGAGRPAVRALLDDQRLTELLLPVVHGRRGVLDRRGVTLQLFDNADEHITSVVDEVVDLGEALAQRLEARADNHPPLTPDPSPQEGEERGGK